MASVDSAPRTLVGAVLSRRWRLVRMLGEGGMGEVYAAEPLAGGAPVAVKILRPEYIHQPQVLSRFLEEAQVCIRLIHPNIVRMFESLTAEDGSPYIVMELLEGVPLGAYTDNGGRVPVAQAVPILQGILAGLAAAHAQGIVHRDLKPDNAFLTRAPDGTFAVKVLDFGIAKVMEAAGGMGNRTRTGMLLGTPGYMSPEQIKNAREVDQRADLWGAGVMFYEMLTGRVAFPAPTEYARLTAVLTSEPEPIERIDPALAPLAAFVRRALAKNRDDRFGSALEMARALALAAPQSSQRGDGSVGQMMAAAALPLSRLPEVPSVFGPSFSPPAPTAHDGAGQYSSQVSPPLSGLLAQPLPQPQPPSPTARAPGGTLASPAGSTPPVAEAQPNVVMVVAPPRDETLPSKDLPVIVRGVLRAGGGVAPWAVVLLVAVSLLAGFLLGWAAGRAP